MRKVICVWLPTWPIDRLRRRLNRHGLRGNGPSPGGRGGQSAIVLVAESHGRLVVRRCCEVAARTGVCDGMSLAHARSLLTDQHLHVAEHQPKRDAAALDALARWAHRLAPIVAVDDTHDAGEPEGLLLDVTGCQRLYGSDDRILAHVRHALASIRLPARCAMAATVGAAWARARYTETCDVQDAPAAFPTHRASDIAHRTSLSSLPVHGLRLSPSTLEALAEVAIDTVGDLLAIPRRELFERFGDEPLRRIDQMTGRVAEPITPIRPVDPPRAERAFDGPVVRVEAIDLAVRQLLAELADELHRRSVGARRIVLAVERYEAVDTRLAVTLAGPCAEADHLVTLWRPRIERLNLGRGVERLTLIADRVDRLSAHQHTRWVDTTQRDHAAHEAALTRWVDTLAARLGAEGVCTVEPVATHVPHAAFRRRPFDSSDTQRRRAAAVADTPLVDADRPSLLHETPRPIRVVMLNPDGPVLTIDVGGQTHRVRHTIGPERIAGRWWCSPDPDRPTPQRDYFKLQDETGRWWWVYREVERGRWFAQGTWD